LPQRSVIVPLDPSAGAVHAQTRPWYGLKPVVGNRLFTCDADSVFLFGDPLQGLLDFGYVSDLALHCGHHKLAIVASEGLRGLIVYFIFDNHFPSQLIYVTSQFFQSGSQQVLEVLKPFGLTLSLLGLHRFLSLASGASFARLPITIYKHGEFIVSEVLLFDCSRAIREFT
jgi:hypothetical protein